MTAIELKRALQAVADPEKATFYPRFFKAGKGEYGEGDRFLGVVVPEQRKIARRFRDLALSHVRRLLKSPIHEHRHTALLILAEKVRRGDEADAKKIYEFTLEHVERINNWDLVDLAAPKLIGPFVQAHPREMKRLDSYSRSSDLWKRRIAIVSTYPFIKSDDFGPTLRFATRLIDDEHDLIHKATGWMLREVGNRDRETLERFLEEQAGRMPRTMLRYAIEKLPQTRRKRYMNAR